MLTNAHTNWEVDLMHIMAVLIHSFGEVLHSVEQGAQGLLAGQGLPEGSQEGGPLPSNVRCLILEKGINSNSCSSCQGLAVHPVCTACLNS